MRLLSDASALSNAELARALNVSPQATSVVIRELIARGLVERQVCTSTGRSQPITLSSKGARLLERTNHDVRQAEQRALQKVTPQQRRELKQILGVLS